MQNLLGLDTDGNVLLKPLSEVETQFQTLQNHVARIDQRLNATDAKINTINRNIGTINANINTNKTSISTVNNLIVLKTKHFTKCPAKFWENQNNGVRQWTNYKSPDAHSCAMTCPKGAFTYGGNRCYCRPTALNPVQIKALSRGDSRYVSGVTCDYK